MEAMQDCNLDHLLPPEVWMRILRFVDPEDILAIADVSPLLASFTSDRSVVGTVRFSAETLSEDTLSRFLRAPRAAAISNLDLTNCVLPPSTIVEQGLARCVNLTTLRCVNCRLSSRALFQLVLTRLDKLELLHWSLLGCREGRDEMRPALMVLDSKNSRGTSGIRSMYVELVESAVHVHTLARFLPRCPRLRDLHVHVLGASSCEGCSPGAPTTYGDRPLAELERFTYTTDAARGRCPYASRSAFIESRELWHLLLGDDEPLVQAFRGYATLCNNVALRLRPHKSRSCVHLSELLVPASDEASMPQMCVTVDEPGQLSAAATARGDRWSSLDALTLLSPLPLNRPTFPPGVGALYEAPLKTLLGACSALGELNLSRFHFTPDLSCCALLASACLRHLRALSLPACALAEPNSIEDLARAPFTLQELDVRGSATTAHSVCAVCSDPRTCGDASLAPLALLGPLRRLTLCGLSNVHSVQFLAGCRVRELRLSHLGRRGLCCYTQGLGTVLAAQADGLRVLKMEHSALTLSSHLLLDQITKASSLELLCLTSNTPLRPAEQQHLLDMLVPRLRQLRALHVHAPGVRPLPRRLQGQPRIHFDGSNGDDANPTIVFTNELSILCRASNFIGLTKPYNRDPQPVPMEAVKG
ncbi:hypothetical protein HPB49_005670 [Dermacentor silvarum]|uniref:Uncharacterized protein n=1 Tax=Dermacentor silvarum TaxID=543639 RepID=A0ACB8C7G5_DERSI|nr:uncharacterized protein LOC119461782 isoform X1 [Dermacentor silvarum]KAH7936824.1 hypothetical protein HPB49_005670 [Dermacentor silvarum]